MSVKPRLIVFVAYCLRGSQCGNPYDGGKFFFHARTGMRCPRCGGPISHKPVTVAGRHGDTRDE